MHVTIVVDDASAQHGRDGFASSECQDDRERQCAAIPSATCHFADQFRSIEDHVDFSYHAGDFLYVISAKVEGVNATDGGRENASGRVKSVADIQSDVIAINYASSFTKWRRAASVEKKRLRCNW